MLSLEAFRAKFLNQHTIIRDANGKEKAVTFATAWLSDFKRRTYDGIEFRPDPSDATGTKHYLNLWRGFGLKAKGKTDGYAIFRDHLLSNVCSGDAELYGWLFGWFAHLVQRPRERPGTALVFRGRMGAGKTKIGEVVGSLFPSHYFLVDDPRYVVGQFNAHMASCLLLQADEAVWAGSKEAEGRLKGLITSNSQMIEQKGVDAVRLDNFVRLIMTSNEGWVVPAGKDERRWAVFDVDPRCAQNHDYFREMQAELDNGGREALLHDLLTFDLSKVDPCTIPRTNALLEQKIRSLDPLDSWWLERLRSGSTLAKGEQWLERVPCDALYDDYIAVTEKVGVRRKAEATAFGMGLKKLVPDIQRRRVTTASDAMDGLSSVRRAWCYQLPSLDDCRSLFEEAMGQAIAWDAP